MNPIEVVDAQLHAYNARDVRAFMSCYAFDVVIEDAVGNLVMQGHDQVAAEYAQFFESHADLHADVVSRISIGDYVIDDEVIRGMGPEPVRAVVAYRARADAIDHVRIYRE
jgi:hypothetical protein